MRHFLISALLISLVSGCSSVNLGPHRIDVQQGNALDQENIVRLKPGLNRSQVRFLLGTPLVVDPFRTDRWDYVYVFYKAGKLAEQKHITLFFDGEILARIEGDLPPVAPAVTSTVATPKPESSMASNTAVEATPLPARLTPTAEAIPVVQSLPPQQPVQSASAEASPKPVVQPSVEKPIASPTLQPDQSAAVTSSVVSPLPSPKNAPAYVDPHTPAALSLQAETNVDQVKPDVIPSFPGASKGADKGDESIIKALNTWVGAWMRRDEAAYFAAYDTSFVPPGGDSRADWEKRRHLLFGVAESIDIKIDSPSIDRTEEGAVTMTFNQHYRSDNYRDAVVKQLLMVERDGRWLIAEEKVLSTLSGTKR
ncbi:MAG: outer membrane protein assembly factor BamE [Thiobacillus sp.]|nr:outer membrane protein assembly factor BamE [Thiobacillus sp.]